MMVKQRGVRCLDPQDWLPKMHIHNTQKMIERAHTLGAFFVGEGQSANTSRSSRLDPLTGFNECGLLINYHDKKMVTTEGPQHPIKHPD